MSDHLSALALDEAAIGLPLQGDDQAHLAGCRECEAAVEELKGLNARIMATPRAKTLRAGPLTAPPARPRQPRILKLVPLAAALALFTTLAVLKLGPQPADRIKGAPSVAVLLKGSPVSAAPVGAHVQLAVGGAGHAFGAVFALEPNGTITALWPTGTTMEVVGAGAQVPLPAEFEVTPGGIRVVAAFADAAVSLETVKQALSRVGPGPVPPRTEGLWLAEQRLEAPP